MTFSETIRRARGILSVLTSPLWFIPAVIVRGLGYAKWDIRYTAASIALTFRKIGKELVWAWKDEALALRIKRVVHVTSPATVAGKAAAKAAGSFLRTQVLRRLVALAFLVVSPIVILWAIIETLREEDFFGGLAEVYADVFRVIVFAEQPR